MTFVTKVLGKLTLLLAAQSPEFGCYIQRLIFNGDESHIRLFRCLISYTRSQYYHTFDDGGDGMLHYMQPVTSFHCEWVT